MSESFRVPADEAYTAMLGRAVYNFAYLEWGVIYTVDTLKPGYLQEYTTASKPLPSGTVANEFREAVIARVDLPSGMKDRLAVCAADFSRLVNDRNRLIHAHPYTADGGAQQLGYQGRLPAATWSIEEVVKVAEAFDAAACEMNDAFYQLKALPPKP